MVTHNVSAVAKLVVRGHKICLHSAPLGKVFVEKLGIGDLGCVLGGNNIALEGPRHNGAKKTHHTELQHGRNDVHICLKNVPISWIF